MSFLVELKANIFQHVICDPGNRDLSFFGAIGQGCPLAPILDRDCPITYYVMSSYLMNCFNHCGNTLAATNA